MLEAQGIRLTMRQLLTLRVASDAFRWQDENQLADLRDECTCIHLPPTG